MKDDVVFETYEDQIEMKKKILNIIFNHNSEKILYKGNPMEINYKLLKKILPGEMIETKNIRDSYNKFISNIECKNCLIYKK